MLSRVIASGREVLTRVLVEGDKVLIPEMTQTDVSVSDISNCLEHDIYNERWRFFGASLFNPGHRVSQCRICLFRYLQTFLQHRF